MQGRRDGEILPVVNAVIMVPRSSRERLASISSERIQKIKGLSVVSRSPAMPSFFCVAERGDVWYRLLLSVRSSGGGATIASDEAIGVIYCSSK